MDKTRVMVEFNIYGDSFDPVHVTEKLGVKPDITYLKGDIVDGRPKIKKKETSWSIETGYEEVLDINDVLARIMNKISSKVDVLNYIRQIYEINFLFMFVIKIYNNETPAMYFNKEFIEFAGNIGAEIGFDTYVIYD